MSFFSVDILRRVSTKFFYILILYSLCIFHQFINILYVFFVFPSGKFCVHRFFHENVFLVLLLAYDLWSF